MTWRVFVGVALVAFFGMILIFVFDALAKHYVELAREISIDGKDLKTLERETEIFKSYVKKSLFLVKMMYAVPIIVAVLIPIAVLRAVLKPEKVKGEYRRYEIKKGRTHTHTHGFEFLNAYITKSRLCNRLSV